MKSHNVTQLNATTPVHTLAIVGGAGFVGTNLALAAVGEVRQVDIYDFGDRLGRLHHSGLLRHPKVTLHERVPGEQLVLDRRPDAIVNLAAWAHVDHSLHQPRAVVENNVLSALDVLEEARRLDTRVLFTSSVEVYGGNDGDLFTEDSNCQPLSPYAATKVAGEALASAYTANFGVQAAVVRLTNLYGPWQSPDRLIPRIISQQLHGIPSQVESGRLRDFVHVHDAVRALLALVHLDVFPAGETFNIATGIGVANEHIGHRVRSLIGFGSDMEIRPSRKRDGRGPALLSSAQHLVERLSWNPAIDLDAGLADTVAWYREHRDWLAPLESCFAAPRNTPRFMVDYPAPVPGLVTDWAGRSVDKTAI